MTLERWKNNPEFYALSRRRIPLPLVALSVAGRQWAAVEPQAGDGQWAVDRRPAWGWPQGLRECSFVQFSTERREKTTRIEFRIRRRLYNLRRGPCLCASEISPLTVVSREFSMEP